MNATDVIAAAEGADLIVHAVNPPGYRHWHALVLPMIDHTIAAARASGARIVLPGTVYNYGCDTSSRITESTPQNPHTRKGRIRVELERRLETAAARGIRVLIVRAGDFFGPRAGNNWFSQALVKPRRPIRSISYPGRSGIGHQWAYLPDVAKTMIRLVARSNALPNFATFHMDGHWDDNGTRMVEAIREVVDNAKLPVRAFPWWALRWASPFVPICRELCEMHYLWQEPVRLDNQRLVATLGREPRTRLVDAVRTTIEGLGAGPAPSTASERHAT